MDERWRGMVSLIALHSFFSLVQFAMSPDPSSWGAALTPGNREPDDDLHNPDPKRDRRSDKGGTILTLRGIANLGCLAFLFIGIGMLLYVNHASFQCTSQVTDSSPSSAGYPMLSHFLNHPQATLGGFNLGGINASGQVSRQPIITAVTLGC